MRRSKGKSCLKRPFAVSYFRCDELTNAGGSTNLAEEFKNEIVEKLKSIDPEKVILFGSRAWGDAVPESDIDLYVVTKDDFVPSTCREKSLVHLKVVR